MTADLDAQIDIDASPEHVWTVVSDLRRMGEWSPQCRKVVVRGPLRAGSRTINLNRSGWKVWPTRSEVVTFEPHREVAFKVLENGCVWSYELAALEDGSRTRVIERRRAPQGTSAVSRTLIKHVLGGEQGFEDELRAGMAATLERIKAEAEQR